MSPGPLGAPILLSWAEGVRIHWLLWDFPIHWYPSKKVPSLSPFNLQSRASLLLPTCRILIPRPGIKPMPPALGVQSVNHGTTREVQGVACDALQGQDMAATWLLLVTPGTPVLGDFGCQVRNLVKKDLQRDMADSWWLRQERICLQCRIYGLDPWVGKIPWRSKWQPTPGFLPGEFHGQRSLVG